MGSSDGETMIDLAVATPDQEDQRLTGAGECHLLLGILPLRGLVVVLSQQCSECTPVQFCEALLTVLGRGHQM